MDSAGNIYAAGEFTHAGDVALNHVARWNESNQRWEPLGDGLSRSVFALATDSARRWRLIRCQMCDGAGCAGPSQRVKQ